MLIAMPLNPWQVAKPMGFTNFGEWLRNKIDASGRPQVEFAEAIKVQPVTLRSWFYKPTMQIRRDAAIRLAKELNVSITWLEERFGKDSGSISKMLYPGAPMGENGDVLHKDGSVGPDLDQNVDPLTLRKFFEIPLFDLSISAGGWSELVDTGETRDPRSIDQGLFRVRLSGDSMEAIFPNGSVVEFCVIRPSAPTIEIGRHYYIHRYDDMATFKTLKEMTAENLTFAAVNKKKYPKPIVVDRSEIVRIAVAVAKVEII